MRRRWGFAKVSVWLPENRVYIVLQLASSVGRGAGVLGLIQPLSSGNGAMIRHERLYTKPVDNFVGKVLA